MDGKEFFVGILFAICAAFAASVMAVLVIKLFYWLCVL